MYYQEVIAVHFLGLTFILKTLEGSGEMLHFPKIGQNLIRDFLVLFVA